MYVGKDGDMVFIENRFKTKTLSYVSCIENQANVLIEERILIERFDGDRLGGVKTLVLVKKSFLYLAL